MYISQLKKKAINGLLKIMGIQILLPAVESEKSSLDSPISGIGFDSSSSPVVEPLNIY